MNLATSFSVVYFFTFEGGMTFRKTLKTGKKLNYDLVAVFGG